MRSSSSTVGNIVLTTGYDLYDAAKIERYGYGTLPNVLTSLEFERLTNASGPTSGKIVMKALQPQQAHEERRMGLRRGEGSPPKSVAIIHCVGSRDANHNEYCSRVCCMYSLKFAHLVREKLPDAICHEFYIDMRAFGKGYEEFAERIKAEGTRVVRGRTAKVIEEGGHMVIKGEDIISESMIDLPVDMVVLAVGLVHADGSDELAGLLRIDTDRHGWFSELDYNSDPTDTERGGIFVAGACQGPKDIPDTVAQASAVAAGVLKSIAVGRGVSRRRRPFTGRHRGASRTPGPGLRRGTHGHTSQPQAYRRTGSLRRPGREQVLSLRQLLRVVPVLQGPVYHPAARHALPADGAGDEARERPPALALLLLRRVFGGLPARRRAR